MTGAVFYTPANISVGGAELGTGQVEVWFIIGWCH